MSEIHPNLGERLRRLREEKGFSRSALARRAGLDPEKIQKIEADEAEITVPILRKLAAALEIDIFQLLAVSSPEINYTVRLASPGENLPPGHMDVVPVPIVSGNVAGGNARIVNESILDWLFLPQKEFGDRSGRLVAVEIFGRSMEPDIPDGSIVVVDRGDRDINPESFYALRDTDGGCTIKRVQILDEAYVALVPSNRDEFRVEFWKLDLGESLNDRVIGKVVWVGRNLLRQDKVAENRPPYGRPNPGRGEKPKKDDDLF
ncbi:MAG: XRE family transcriptional regulator [bacterium]|nr:XRE family transcriptional regulator [bacterium]